MQIPKGCNKIEMRVEYTAAVYPKALVEWLFYKGSKSLGSANSDHNMKEFDDLLEELKSKGYQETDSGGMGASRNFTFEK